jgi:microcystin-dependent protein
MANPFVGEIRMAGFGFAPSGWALCNGQSMPINQNQALFSLLGTTFGGNGVTTFFLPDLRGRVPINAGALTTPPNPTYNWGQNGGEEQHTLVINEIPNHTHFAVASSASPNSASPSPNYWANGPQQLYVSSPLNTPMAGSAIANAGNNQPHENRSPYTVISFIIALTGIFPSRG